MGKQSAVASIKAPKPPKSKCCVSKKRCGSCPIRMLKEGTLPEGYGVKKRVLVKVDPDAPDIVRPGKKSKKGKDGSKSAKKAAKRAARLGQAA
ncbi:hypothetical protein [Nocardioides sp. AX2bis]|uniref:hypothetical protein n=1 Tax=Nocardioides sp. AX2bis TaxID=2653157 RepID=UPI0012F2E864|nr:hypothetical protein [Nocardioides sp. AX2bis]VXB21361.1 hypothetical protein NOCARDAX2BIS_170069 [Nocardioides sp. AX2bis]